MLMVLNTLEQISEFMESINSIFNHAPDKLLFMIPIAVTMEREN